MRVDERIRHASKWEGEPRRRAALVFKTKAILLLVLYSRAADDRDRCEVCTQTLFGPLDNLFTDWSVHCKSCLHSEHADKALQTLPNGWTFVIMNSFPRLGKS